MMKRRTGTLLLGIAAACLTLAACEDAGSKSPASPNPSTTTSDAPVAKAEPREITLDEALALHKAGASFFDVNNPGFRQENGVVSGAKLVASAARYDVATTLPAEKDAHLIFYCTSRS